MEVEFLGLKTSAAVVAVVETIVCGYLVAALAAVVNADVVVFDGRSVVDNLTNVAVLVFEIVVIVEVGVAFIFAIVILAFKVVFVDVVVVLLE